MNADNNVSVIEGGIVPIIDIPSVKAKARLSAAIMQAQKHAQAVVKGATNTFHKYSYASAEQMLVESKEALLSSGVEVHRGSYRLKELAANVVCEMDIEVTHPESGESERHTVDYFVIPDKGRPLDKALNSALTTSFAYFLRDLLLIPRLSRDEAEALKEQDKAGDVCGRDDRKYEPGSSTQPVPPGKGKRSPGADLLAQVNDKFPGSTEVNEHGESKATPERVAVLKSLIASRKIPGEKESKWLEDKQVKTWDEASPEVVENAIKYLEKMPAKAA